MILRRLGDPVQAHSRDHVTAQELEHDSEFSKYDRTVNRRKRRWSSIVALSFILMTCTGLIPPHRSGFTCDDSNIRKSYHGDSISIYTLFCGVLFGPILLFAVTEAIHQSYLAMSSSSKSDCVGGTSQCRTFLGRWGCVVSDYLLGLVYLLALVELGKVLMGELRPHFLETCRPDWTLINCSQGVVTNYVCLGDVPKWLKVDMFKSFPSGHAALSTYAFVFASMYSQTRIYRTNYSHLLRSWVQLLFLLWACLCSLTRLTDNRHHWWDILIGIFMGLAAGVFTVCISLFFECIPRDDRLSICVTGELHYNKL